MAVPQQYADHAGQPWAQVLPPARATDSQLILNWQASTDDASTISSYEILRNGVQVGAVTGTTFTDIGLDAATGYNYSVIAFDAAGNESSPATTSGTTGADVTPPDAPVDLQVTGVTSGSVSLVFGCSRGIMWGWRDTTFISPANPIHR